MILESSHQNLEDSTPYTSTLVSFKHKPRACLRCLVVSFTVFCIFRAALFPRIVVWLQNTLPAAPTFVINHADSFKTTGFPVLPTLSQRCHLLPWFQLLLAALALQRLPSPHPPAPPYTSMKDQHPLPYTKTHQRSRVIATTLGKGCLLCGKGVLEISQVELCQRKRWQKS